MRPQSLRNGVSGGGPVALYIAYSLVRGVASPEGERNSHVPERGITPGFPFVLTHCRRLATIPLNPGIK